MVFSRSQLLQRSTSLLLWRFYIRLSTVISLLYSIAKAASWFRPRRIVIHACLWGKYLNELEKLMSWSLISLNLQYYNHGLLSYNRKLYIVYLRKQTLKLHFWDNPFSLYLKKLQNIIVRLYPAVFHIHTSSQQ